MLVNTNTNALDVFLLTNVDLIVNYQLYNIYMLYKQYVIGLQLMHTYLEYIFIYTVHKRITAYYRKL